MSNKPQLLADLEKNAQEITDYYNEFSKNGVIGAGEFLLQGASWDFEGQERPNNLWTDARKKRGDK